MLDRVRWITNESSQCGQIRVATAGKKVVTEGLLIMLARDSGETSSVSQYENVVDSRVFCWNRGYAGCLSLCSRRSGSSNGSYVV